MLPTAIRARGACLPRLSLRLPPTTATPSPRPFPAPPQPSPRASAHRGLPAVGGSLPFPSPPPSTLHPTRGLARAAAAASPPPHTPHGGNTHPAEPPAPSPGGAGDGAGGGGGGGVGAPPGAPPRHLPPELALELPPGCKAHPSLLPLLHRVLELYAERTPSLHTVLGRVTRRGWPGVGRLGQDHLAFRSLGVPGLGLPPLLRLFTRLGYRTAPGPRLAFPAKRLAAAWLAAPHGSEGALPRLFVSELEVHELSPATQSLIRRHTAWAEDAGEAEVDVAVLTSLLTGSPPWPAPAWGEWQALREESEYGAWVLAHGYALNHTALALHRLPGHTAEGAAEGPQAGAVEGPQAGAREGPVEGADAGPLPRQPGGLGPDIRAFTGQLKAAGLGLNGEGGEVKVAPDGLLLQAATVADTVPCTFAGGEVRAVAGAYVEFVQRLVLPQFAQLEPTALVEPLHLREGFEVANADAIFDSTRLAAGGGAGGEAAR